MRRACFALLVAALGVLALSASASASSTQGVLIQDFTYNPKMITIDVGDSVQWTNKDEVAHTVTADDDSFDTSPGCDIDHQTDESCLKPNEPVSVTFDSPGTFTYHCRIHGAQMQGTIVVKSTATTEEPTPSSTTTSSTTSTSTTTSTTETTTTTSSTTTSTTSTTLARGSDQVAISDTGGGGGSNAVPLAIGVIVVVAGIAGLAYWRWSQGGGYDDPNYWDDPPPTTQGPRL